MNINQAINNIWIEIEENFYITAKWCLDDYLNRKEKELKELEKELEKERI